MTLSVMELRFEYPTRGRGQVLDGVGFEALSGELLAVLGPNGVGKTTLLRCLNRMLTPTSGAVLVEGAEIFSLSPPEIARLVGYVAQRSEAGRMTAFDAVLLGRKPHMGWRVKESDLARAGAALRQVGMEDMALRFIDQMSGGELQKICIARALAQEPRALLLDEPTSALDLRNKQEILKTIKWIVAEHGIAAIMTMHDLNAALRFADKLLFVKDGKAFTLCKPEQVQAEVIEAVYGLRVEIVRHGRHTLVVPLENEHGGQV